MRPLDCRRTLGTCLVVAGLAMDGAARPVMGTGQPDAAAALVVTAPADVVNGDISSPDALTRLPGADGISLREAVEAANNAAGPVTIRLSEELAGLTLVPLAPLFLRHDGITLAGPRDGLGRPQVTLDASAFRGSRGIDDRALIMVLASDVTVAGLRITGVPSRRTAISIQAGAQHLVIAPQRVERVRIEDNDFDNTGTEIHDFGFAIQLSMGPRDTAADATIAGVVVARNRFRHYRPDGNGLNIGSRGVNNTIRDVVIEGNRFEQVRYQVELATNPGSGNRILGTRIASNHFADGGVAVWLGNIGNDPDVPADRNAVEDTLIWGNVFAANVESPIGVTGGLGRATASVVHDTRIINNVMLSGIGGMFFTGGSGAAAVNNAITDVRITNNTLVRQAQSAIGVVENDGGAAANRIQGILVTNTIFQGPDRDFNGLSTAQVFHSITSTRALNGVNGNLAADPRFVDASAGDLRLREGSPAIDRGSTAAPDTDFDCRRRAGPPDIGAFEYGGLLTECPSHGARR